METFCIHKLEARHCPLCPAWNPRYAAYALSHGKTENEMRDQDEIEYPGGRMTGFTVWISEKWRTWKMENSIADREPLTNTHHAAFDKWIGI
jgi:hypothetical protein